MNGLYLSIDKNANIKRKLTTYSGEFSLDTSTVAEEIINFSELNFKPYADILEMIDQMSEDVEFDDPEYFGMVDTDKYYSLLKFVNNVLDVFEEDNQLYGALTRFLLEDQVPPDDGSAMYIYYTKDRIRKSFSAIIELQMVIHNILDDLIQNTPAKEFNDKYADFSKCFFTQIQTMQETECETYFLRSIIDYYLLLIMKFVKAKPNIAKCACCGQFFIPKTKHKTIYCDRILSNGKTCKELAPILKHKLQTQTDSIVELFDRTRRKMYKRLERSENSDHELNHHLNYADYYAWLSTATAARDAYLNGEISAQEAVEKIKI